MRNGTDLDELRRSFLSSLKQFEEAEEAERVAFDRYRRFRNLVTELQSLGDIAEEHPALESKLCEATRRLRREESEEGGWRQLCTRANEAEAATLNAAGAVVNDAEANELAGLNWFCEPYRGWSFAEFGGRKHRLWKKITRRLRRRFRNAPGVDRLTESGSDLPACS